MGNSLTLQEGVWQALSVPGRLGVGSYGSSHLILPFLHNLMACPYSIRSPQVGVYVCMNILARVWRPKVYGRCFLSFLLHLVFEMGSLPDTELASGLQGFLSAYPQHYSTQLSRGCWGSICGWKMGTLLTEPISPATRHVFHHHQPCRRERLGKWVTQKP